MMVAVLRLVEFTNKDTVSALRCLLADALAGKLSGAAILYRTRDGVEDSVFTGAYRARPSEAASSALRLSMALTRVQND